MAPESRRRSRRSIRLRNYDYSRPGYYFVTICTANRDPLFGRIEGSQMVGNGYAGIVRLCWEELTIHYPYASLDAFVIMPNHVHGIVTLTDGPGTRASAAIRHGLPEIVRALKTYSARRINASRGTLGTSVWQRGYYERIIRNEHELRLTRKYIASNPRNRRKDREHNTQR